MTEMQRKIGEWAGQRIIVPGISNLFGKNYIWLQDHDGTIYTLPVDENNVPQFD